MLRMVSHLAHIPTTVVDDCPEDRLSAFDHVSSMSMELALIIPVLINVWAAQGFDKRWDRLNQTDVSMVISDDHSALWAQHRYRLHHGFPSRDSKSESMPWPV